MSKIYVDEIAGIASPSTVAIPGHVIQAAFTQVSTSQAISTAQTWTDISNASVSFTPKKSNSTLLIDAVTHVFVDGNVTGWETVTTRIVAGSDVQNVQSGANDLYGLGIRAGDNTDIRLMGYDVKSWSYAVSSTDPITIKIQMYANSLIGGATVNGFGVGSLRIMEIAG